MKPKAIILIIIALGCGLVASIGISQVMRSNNSNNENSTEMEGIYVAKIDVDLGQVLNAEMLKREEWPVEKIPEDAVRNLEDLEGRRPKHRLYAGEPILEKKLIDGNSFGGESDRIPKGFRLATVTVDERDIAGGLLKPGDRVDVLVYLRKSADIGESRATRVLTNVRVFAVGSHTTREVDTEGNILKAKTVSLLVKLGQDTLLLLAGEQGKMSLSMRRSDDNEEESAEDATGRLLLGKAKTASTALPLPMLTQSKQPAPQKNAFLDWLKEQQATAVVAAPAVQKTEERPKKFTMDIVGPQGFQRWVMGGPGEMPRPLVEVTTPQAGRIDTGKVELPAAGSDPAGVSGKNSVTAEGSKESDDAEEPLVDRDSEED